MKRVIIQSPTTRDGDDETVATKLFPQKLMGILSDSTNHEAISWLPQGKSFVITNREKFSNSVLQKYFRGTKYASFIRKLNRWNFKRVAKGPEQGAYHHEFFQRDQESLCIQMYCKNDRSKFATSAQKKHSAFNETDITAKVQPSNNALEHLSSNLSNIIMHHEKLFTPEFYPIVQIQQALLGATTPNQIQLTQLLTMANPHLCMNPQEQHYLLDQKKAMHQLQLAQEKALFSLLKNTNKNQVPKQQSPSIRRASAA
mmetsp:Transcript_27597/g.40752  ORF Transcript_27597/g.40752 Transcript_27597/m.40752 type:complete len:257 (+) Transcript_27597:28-798(+)|eukprot:CAMPEP_0194199498 /NCGR_PEP_ID=MMETSP0156-20130528/496_1 /TAXON_ID=33649 /ORGANISM="Thalassionema nitzschioides, Strain L26-B" /LENGTH=256 /DNA_ID=CAMNT_0038924399 /DNA_START=28 /DNA_END=798 /DNA_ORIENTATION=+